MAENIQRSTGRPKGYKFDRGGAPVEFGPYIGEVRNNIDPTRSGRLQVYIEEFAGENKDDVTLWRTVRYASPFYGYTEHSGTDVGTGNFVGNKHTYGMWFTPPDIGTKVLCFFAAGDPNQGYYTGCVIDPGVTHMVPAIGASRKFLRGNDTQNNLFQGVDQLPVTEINSEDPAISEDPRFFDKAKPVHSVVAGVMFQQGLIKDTVRGPIGSTSQRESPSAVYGLSTPGKAIYQGGLSEADIKNKLQSGQVNPADIKVIGRRGGHSIVLDDGDLEGNDTLVRIRTAKGHQITMSDSGDCFYITHANGQTWIELGKEGTVDVFSTNSVNVRTQGTINLHADKDINMYAGGSINALSKVSTTLESQGTVNLLSQSSMTLYSKISFGVLSDGSLALKAAKTGSFDGGSGLNMQAGCINLNSGGVLPVSKPVPVRDYRLADTKFDPQTGWQVEFNKLPTAVTRAPTHEPYPYHNQGVNASANLSVDSDKPSTEAVAGALASVADLPVTNGIAADDFVMQNEATLSVGKLDTTQVTGLLAQQSKDVGQAFDVISIDKGIGKFGFDAAQLESNGFLKPGTVQTFLKDPAQLEEVLSSPSVWTGKSGVGSLTGLLADEGLQDLAQNTIMLNSFEGLKSAGVLTGSENSRDIAGLVQTASKYGVDTTTSWIKGQAPADLIEDIKNTARSAQYAVDFVDTKLDNLSQGFSTTGGFVATSDRTGIDEALGAIIGNAKVPTPDFASNVYATTPDSALIYTGNDPIVLERINAERTRRGLIPLALGGGYST